MLEMVRIKRRKKIVSKDEKTNHNGSEQNKTKKIPTNLYSSTKPTHGVIFVTLVLYFPYFLPLFCLPSFCSLLWGPILQIFRVSIETRLFGVAYRVGV